MNQKKRLNLFVASHQKTDAETLDDSNPEGKSDHCGYPLKESANGTENGKNTSKNKCGGRNTNFLNSHDYTVVTILILRIYTHGFSVFSSLERLESRVIVPVLLKGWLLFPHLGE